MESIDKALSGKSKKLEGLRKHPLPPPFSEMSLDELADILSLTIKHDYENKIVTFLCMLSAYTHKSQINISFNAPSSSGKTYMTTEIAKLFPKEDKIELSGASPTSFFYGEGEQDHKRKAKIVKLSRKILIFYEQPGSELQAKLRSVLSHDSWEIVYRITNKGAKGQNRAEQIILQGHPATVFCSAVLRLDEQEATRAILLSPEVTVDKLKEGVHLQAMRGANEDTFKASIESEPKRISLKTRIRAIRDEQVNDIIVPEPEKIEMRFNEMVKSVKPRHMRDMGHLMKLIKAIALLNIWQRKKSSSTYIASQEDIDQAFKLWQYFADSQELNIPPALIVFYKQFIIPAYNEKKTDYDFTEGMEQGKIGLTRHELARYYLKIEKTMLNDENLRKQVLPQLENSGLIQQITPDVGDKRSRHIVPLWFNDENNIGNSGGTPEEESTIDLEDIPF